MFEGHINRAGHPDTRESEVLRQFRWTELVARLAATRDIREEMGRSGEAAFHAFATVRRGGETGKPVVNQSGLSDGKDSMPFRSEPAADAAQGDRETE